MFILHEKYTVQSQCDHHLRRQREINYQKRKVAAQCSGAYIKAK